MEHAPQAAGAKSATFQMRVNPEVKKEAEGWVSLDEAEARLGIIHE